MLPDHFDSNSDHWKDYAPPARCWRTEKKSPGRKKNRPKRLRLALNAVPLLERDYFLDFNSLPMLTLTGGS
jgi:hypothetical protein